MSDNKAPAPETHLTGDALRILQEGIDGAEADMQSDADAGERVDLFDYEIALPYETGREIAALLRSASPENHTVGVEDAVKAADSALISGIHATYRDGEFHRDELLGPDEMRKRVAAAIRDIGTNYGYKSDLHPGNVPPAGDA